MTGPPTLRERKKRATREALQSAALRLALERGPDNVRVEEIAQAAGVSPRTYNNYFASREQAIVAGVAADRAVAVTAAVLARPTGVSLGDTVVDAVVGLYTDPGDHPPAALLMIAASPALRACYVDAVTTIEEPLAEALTARCPGLDRLTAQVLAAAVGAAVRVALRQWLHGTNEVPAMVGFVVPSRPLPDLVRAALAPLAPALDAATP
ncbi:TetR/AcrR family transcriptional regulator [Micromonospora sp. RL09-050-HVF-A]|uniref:TetR/AcrR family transcriptional regulator n=1 Tax=Micromonospora sp. RL09-050-HVF-A TaxID=1703433 RepID=UPI0027E31A5F|nr:TetR/AcrR family transcriptional regulator [Micromonospora sp. RL09-050-HVF-A]